MPDNDIPLSKQATQIPPPTGALQRLCVRIWGYNYRTTLAGYGTAISGVAGFVQMFCPHLADFQWDRKEFIGLLFALATGGGVIKGFHSAKDKSVSGVEK